MLTDPKHTYLNRILKTLDPQIDVNNKAAAVASLRERAKMQPDTTDGKLMADFLRDAADKLEAQA